MPRTPALFQSLEPRRLFAVTATLEGGQLSIIGTNHNDRVELAQEGADVVVTMGGRVRRFNAVDVQDVYVRARAGDDAIIINLPQVAPDVRVYLDGGRDRVQVLAAAWTRTRIFAGDGDDSVYALGSGRCTVYGGAGNDQVSLNQSRGRDLIDGGDGNDGINAGGGMDTLVGGAGNDRLLGDERNRFGAADLIEGGDGHDSLNGFAGNDTLVGGIGWDVLGGGSGNDLLLGDSGDDDLDGGLHSDTLFGGSGNDDRFGFDAAQAFADPTALDRPANANSGDDDFYVLWPEAGI
jgi:Ca2+-binding RTX toxin-like protein